jgi:hypothetical protein
MVIHKTIHKPAIIQNTLVEPHFSETSSY